jgi:hypothetical protein
MRSGQGEMKIFLSPCLLAICFSKSKAKAVFAVVRSSRSACVSAEAEIPAMHIAANKPLRAGFKRLFKV